jgi:hypothetical protein
MDDHVFDHWVRGLEFAVTRRGLRGMVAGAMTAVWMSAEGEAKKHKKKKNKASCNGVKSCPSGSQASCCEFADETLCCPAGSITACCDSQFPVCCSTAITLGASCCEFQCCNSSADCPAGSLCGSGCCVPIIR